MIIPRELATAARWQEPGACYQKVKRAACDQGQTDRQELEQTERRHPLPDKEGAGCHVCGSAYQRTAPAQHRTKGDGHEKFRRRELRPTRHGQDRRDEDRRYDSVVHERGKERDHENNGDQQHPIIPRGIPVEIQADRVENSAFHQRCGNDKYRGQKHHHFAAKAGKCLVRRKNARGHKNQQSSQAEDIDGDYLERKQDQNDGQQSKDQGDLHRSR